jgi:ABC-type glycerol-3-phosphate transport system substrate-binding protein
MLACYSSLDRFRWFLSIIFGMISLINIGCQTTPVIEVNQNPETVAATPTAQPIKLPTIAPGVAITPTAEDEGLILTFWTVEPVSPGAEDQVGAFIDSSLQTFEDNQANIKIKLLTKKASGKGGVLDFLRTAKEAAPSILPDVAIIDVTDLSQAYNDSLIQPLENRLDRSIVQDLLPAARRMGTVNNRLVGVPIGLEMEHTIYNIQVFTTPPLLWADVLSGTAKYLFPAKGVNGLVNDATLAQYFSLGGTFRNDQDGLKINEQALQDVLGFYKDALDLGIIDASLLDAAALEELWPVYLDGQAGITQISVKQYLTNRGVLKDSAFAPLPVRDPKHPPVTITRSWALVLVTTEVDRQRVALRLIEWFLSTSNNATWNSLNNSIPTRDTAYKQLASDDPYWAFLAEQLNKAQPKPSFANYDQVGRIFQQAIEQVIRGEANPDQATATAVDALNP